jgi:hypothetical protein
MIAVCAGVVCIGIGILIGMQIQSAIYRDSEQEIEMELSPPDEVQKEFDRINEKHRIEDSIFRSEHPEYGYPKYNPEDEDTWHLKPKARPGSEEVDTDNETR